MSWPFPLAYIDPLQYFNQITHFYSTFYQNDFTQNQLQNSIPPPFYPFPLNYSLFSQNCHNFSTSSLLEPFQTTYPPNNSLEQHQQSDQQSSHSNNRKSNNQSEEADQIRMVRFRRRRVHKKPKNMISHNSLLRNDTKNIPKNYGKAILTYIQKNSRQAKQLLKIYEVDYLQFMMAVKSFKSKMNTIHELREMWGEDCKEDRIKKCIRILSYHFMRKKCLPYIFNSRVKNYHTHIKYRKKIIEGIQNPQHFTKIKQF